MSEDRIERQIAFIIDQQAKFVTDIDRLREAHERVSEEIAALQGSQRQTTEHIRNLTEALMSLANIVGKHDEQIAGHSSHIAENTKQLAALIEQGKETDARLNALIAVVERHVSNHGGKPPKKQVRRK